MEIKYLVKQFHDECFLEKVRLHIEGIRENGVERVYVFDNTSFVYFDEVRDSTTGKVVIAVVINSDTVTLHWIKDRKYHREDGPGFERYYYDGLGLVQSVTSYYYNGNSCMKTFCSLEEIEKIYEKDNKYIVLGAEKINDNIFYIKVLLKNSIKEQWYWIENRE